MLAATSFGVATIARRALASYPDLLRAQLGVGEDRCVVCGISFGYEDPGKPVNQFRLGRVDFDDALNCVE